MYKHKPYRNPCLNHRRCWTDRTKTPSRHRSTYKPAGYHRNNAWLLAHRDRRSRFRWYSTCRYHSSGSPTGNRCWLEHKPDEQYVSYRPQRWAHNRYSYPGNNHWDSWYRCTCDLVRLQYRPERCFRYKPSSQADRCCSNRCYIRRYSFHPARCIHLKWRYRPERRNRYNDGCSAHTGYRYRYRSNRRYSWFRSSRCNP